mgnify:CR=1 FL=1
MTGDSIHHTGRLSLLADAKDVNNSVLESPMTTVQSYRRPRSPDDKIKKYAFDFSVEFQVTLHLRLQMPKKRQSISRPPLRPTVSKPPTKTSTTASQKRTQPPSTKPSNVYTPPPKTVYSFLHLLASIETRQTSLLERISHQCKCFEEEAEEHLISR